jgi:S-adenosylmethionine/arginine decarboxylase-like enzyme
MTTATNPEYTDVVQKIGQMLFQALWEQEQDLDKKVRELDNIITHLLRKIGLLVETLLLTRLSSIVTKKAKATGLTIHRSKRIRYLSLFGAIEIRRCIIVV